MQCRAEQIPRAQTRCQDSDAQHGESTKQRHLAATSCRCEVSGEQHATREGYSMQRHGSSTRTRSRREPDRLVNFCEADVEVDHHCRHVVITRRRLSPPTQQSHPSHASSARADHHVRYLSRPPHVRYQAQATATQQASALYSGCPALFSSKSTNLRWQHARASLKSARGGGTPAAMTPGSTGLLSCTYGCQLF